MWTARAAVARQLRSPRGAGEYNSQAEKKATIRDSEIMAS